jgi:hypothetical protein
MNRINASSTHGHYRQNLFMIIPKLTVPLINDAILTSCTNCWIATGGISQDGFNFILTRLASVTNCKLLTGLDLPTVGESNIYEEIFVSFQENLRNLKQHTIALRENFYY